MSATSEIIEKIDELLEDDKNFTTRTGLRFMTSVMKEALLVIGKEAEDAGSILFRLGNVEKGLNEFLELRKKEQEKAEVERTKWRWAIISPTIVLLIGEIFRWFLAR